MNILQSRDRGFVNRNSSRPDIRPLHVAYIVSSYSAVTHTFIRNEVEALRDLGVRITVISIHAGTARDRHAACGPSSEQGHVFPLNIGAFFRAHAKLIVTHPISYIRCAETLFGSTANNVMERIRSVFHFAEAVYIAKQLEGQGISHVHAHFGGGPAAAAWGTSLLLGIAYSFSAHRAGLLDQNRGAVYRKVQNAAFVIAISEFNRDYIIALNPSFARKTYVNYCGIDTQRFSPRSGRSIRTDEPAVILSVGSLLKRKGYDYLLIALRLLKEDGVVFRAFIVGEGPERERLERLISICALDGYVQIEGSVDNRQLSKYHDMADMFVLCSVSEGIPVAVMEAMAAGLPVVATNITGVPELVEHDRSGLLVQPRDSVAVYRALKSLLLDRRKREELGRNARDRVVDQFDINKTAEKLKQIFEDEISEGNRARSCRSNVTTKSRVWRECS